MAVKLWAAWDFKETRQCEFALFPPPINDFSLIFFEVFEWNSYFMVFRESDRVFLEREIQSKSIRNRFFPRFVEKS